MMTTSFVQYHNMFDGQYYNIHDVQNSNPLKARPLLTAQCSPFPSQADIGGASQDARRPRIATSSL